MSKKQLLNESEIRRFMTLANLEPLTDRVIKENSMSAGHEAPASSEPKEAEYELEEMQSEDPMDSAESSDSEEMDLGDVGGGSDSLSGLSPEVKKAAVEAVVGLFYPGKSVDVEDDEPGEGDSDDVEDMPAGDEGDDESDMSDEDEAGEEESDEEEAEEMDENFSELQESLVNKILNRVTARLVAEAKNAKKNGKEVITGGRGKSPKKEQKGAAAKMKKMRDSKAKKLAEANAAAPKSTSSNGPKKGAGSATKGTFGVTSKVSDQEWKQGKEGKGGHELENVSASSDHIVSHGKTNLATKGKK